MLDPDNVRWHGDSPIALDEDEALNALFLNAAVAATRVQLGAFLADEPIKPISGEIMTVRATSVIVAAANVWSFGPLTLAQDLPKGRYAIVGAKVVAAATQGLFRFILPNQWNRPGGAIVEAISDAEPMYQRYGWLGNWGEFEHRQPPQLEILEAQDAVNNPDVYLDLIKVG